GLIRQFLASLVILLAAGIAWLFLVPGAPDTLARVGIVLPFGPSTQTEAGTGPGGPRMGGFAGRVTNVVTAAVASATINDTLNAIGEGTPARSVTVMAASAGTLAEVLVRPGQMVDAGDVIARFDSAAEQIEYDRAA